MPTDDSYDIGLTVTEATEHVQNISEETVAFDGLFFDQLASVSAALVTNTKPRQRREPRVPDFAADALGGKLVGHLTNLVIELNRVNLTCEAFRVMERHVYTYEHGKAFNKQWNIGFTSNGSNRFARVGRGYSWNSTSDAGFLAYLEVQKYLKNKQGIMQAVAIDYFKTTDEDFQNPTPSTVISDRPSASRNFRFLGYRLDENALAHYNPRSMAQYCSKQFTNLALYGL